MTRNPALFGAHVSQHSVELDLWSVQTRLVSFPTVALPISLSRATPRRQAEFLAGRHCARESIRRLAPEAAASTIGIGTNREPLWPSGFVGSISHTDNYVSVAVARSTEARAIGLDVERIIDPALADQVCDTVATPDEIKTLSHATRWELPLLLTVVFSAKETLFKCLYPQVQRYFDFHDARVTSIRASRLDLTICLLRDLAAEHRAGDVLQINFEHSSTMVATGMVLT